MEMPVETKSSDNNNIEKETNENNEKIDLIPTSFLHTGNDLQITDGVKFKHPIIQEVIDLDKAHLGLYSEEIYYSMVNLFLTDPYTYMVYLDDKHIDFESISPFETFCLLFEDYTNTLNELAKIPELEGKISEKDNQYFKAFKFFMDIDSFFIAQDENGIKILAYNDNDEDKFLMDSSMYDYIFEFLKKMNGIPDIEKIHPEDEWAKQILIEDERDRLKKEAKKKDKKKEKINRLGNLISAVTWGCNGGITPFNRNQLHMYDLIDGIHRNDKLLSYQNIMNGMYSGFGTVDSKKIDMNKIHWSSD